MAVKPIPEGFHTVTPYLLARDAAKLVEFVKNAFDAREVYSQKMADGFLHAHLRIGDSMVMIGEAPERVDPVPCKLYLYVQDVDAVYQKALAAGATMVSEPRDEFYGDRAGGVRDAFGNQWWVATHVEDVSESELAKRAAKLKRVDPPPPPGSGAPADGSAPK
jgi:uncharacterized glyoxalase superfamily protein PhnB